MKKAKKQQAPTGSRTMKDHSGLHILGKIFTLNIKKLQAPGSARKHISKIIMTNGLHELGVFYHKFKGGGFTGLACLVESHIAIHTWPESGFLTLDIYLCNYYKNNESSCRAVFRQIAEFFEPEKISKKEILR